MKPTTHRNLLPSSPLYDSVEIVRDGVKMKTIPRQVYESAPKPEPITRNPQIISGVIRERAEWLMDRNMALDSTSAANYSNAHGISTLLDELDASLIAMMFEGSLKGRK